MLIDKGFPIPSLKEEKTRAPMCSDSSDNTIHEGATSATPATLTDFEKLCDFGTYVKAFMHCKKGTYWKYSVQAFRKDLLLNAVKLARSIENGTYHPTKTYNFTITERGKPRFIQAPAIRDRVFVHALCSEVLESKIYPKMIYDNSATIKNRGMSFARKRFLAHLRKFKNKHGNNGYILQLDFKKFFDSISHEKLIQEFRKHVKDPKIMHLIEICVNYNGKTKGLGIGSELSQIAGVMFPNGSDFYCKMKRQVKYYGRYMDDIYVIHESKEFLEELRDELIEIAKRLELNFNPSKIKLIKLCNNFVFLKGKYKVHGANEKVFALPCASSLRRAKRRMQRMNKNERIHPDNVHEIYNMWRKSTLKQFPQSKNILKKFDEAFKNTKVAESYFESK